MATIAPIRFTDAPAMLLAGVRRMHTYDGAVRDIPAQWAELRALGTLPGQRGTIAYGAICQAAPDEGTFEYLAGVEVASFDALPPAVGRMRVPAQRYAVFAHQGPAASIRATWAAILGDWLPRSGCRSADTPDFERYDERFDPATGLGGFEIWFPVMTDGAAPDRVSP